MKMSINRLLIAAMAGVVGAGVIGFTFNARVLAHDDDVKLVTDVLTREAQAVEKGDLAALDLIEQGRSQNAADDHDCQRM